MHSGVHAFRAQRRHAAIATRPISVAALANIGGSLGHAGLERLGRPCVSGSTHGQEGDVTCGGHVGVYVVPHLQKLVSG